MLKQKERCKVHGSGTLLLTPTRVRVLPMLAVVVFAHASSASPPGASRHEAAHDRCPDDMQLVADFCMDRYEASTLELTAEGKELPHSPYLPVTGLRVKALSQKGQVPQGYINRDESEAACALSGKRLCTEHEWVAACKGPERTTYPYGNHYKAGNCVDSNRADPLKTIFGALGLARYQFATMNDPRLNQLPNTVALTGSFARCANEYGIYDLVGNLHEWVADPQGTFRGGFYLDTKLNGPGCEYRTTRHPASYHDYSTGFRCCANALAPAN